MRRRLGMRRQTKWWVMLAVLLAGATCVVATVKESDGLEAARRAYEGSDYARAVLELQAAAVKEPQNGEVQLLLTKSYLELQEREAAITSAERAVTIEPQSSVYHEWLGRAYGDKADHSSVFTAPGLARKTHREFEIAVQLDPKNYAARQALIEYYCEAPGIVGGGEEKAKPEIERLLALDAAEGHYATGICHKQKKDFAAAGAEFQLALENHPQRAELIYDIGEYAMRHSEGDQLKEVADVGEGVAPADPRGMFYRAVSLILKNEKLEEAERLLQGYLRKAPKRAEYPHYATAHEWLGRSYTNKGDKQAAEKEYQTALQLDAKDKSAREALKRLEKN